MLVPIAPSRITTRSRASSRNGLRGRSSGGRGVELTEKDPQRTGEKWTESIILPSGFNDRSNLDAVKVLSNRRLIGPTLVEDLYRFIIGFTALPWHKLTP